MSPIELEPEASSPEDMLGFPAERGMPLAN